MNGFPIHRYAPATASPPKPTPVDCGMRQRRSGSVTPPTLGRAVRWRIPGTSSDLLFRDLFRQYPFTVIDEGARWSVSGMCGRIWTLRRDYPRIESADDFLAWDQRGTVRVLLAHWIEPEGPGRNALVSEARIKPVNVQAGLRLRALWAVVGHLDRLIGGEVLRVAARRAARA